MAILPDVSTVSNLSSYITPTTTDLSKVLLNLKSYLDENTAVTNSLINKFKVSKKGNVSPPTNLTCVIDKKGVHWSWNASKDTNIVLYELRFDDQVGVDNGPYKQVTNLQCDCTPLNRVGTAYLYAYNSFGEYGDPVTFSYLKATPSAPTNVNVDSLFQGVKVSFDPIPDDCICATVYLNDSSVVTDNNLVTISDAVGIWDIQVCYVDVFGEGVKSAVIHAGVLPKIDEALIKAETLSLAKMDSTIKDAVAKAQVSIDTTTFNTNIGDLNTNISNLQSDINTINNTTIPNMNTSINNSISALDSAKVSHTDFNNEVNTLTQADSDNRSLINQNADNITTIVGKLNSTPNADGQYTAISSVKQQADSIETTVYTNKTNQDSTNSTMQSNITQNANNISSTVTELNKDPYSATPPVYTAFSKIKQTTDSISSIVTDKANVSDLTVTNNNISAVVAQLGKDPFGAEPPTYNAISQLKLKADSISTDVSNKANASDLTQTANSLSATIAAINTNLNKQPGESPYTSISQLKLTCDNLSSTITNSSSNLQSQITQSAGNISSIVTELGKSIDTCSYTAIAQANSAIQLRAKSANMISLINVCPEAITIDGKYIHITGNTVFDNSVIVNRMLYAGCVTTDKIAANTILADNIAAGAITADKLSVSSLSAITATIGTLRTATSGARTEISDNLISVYDANNILRVRMGVW